VTATSYLYVPGDRPDRFDKAIASGADAVILDLEDAVGLSAKTEARAAVTAHLSSPAGGVEQWVRINTGELGVEDLDAVAAQSGLAGIVVPKAGRAVLEAHAGVTLIALVETAAAIMDVSSLATADVVALAIGEVDLAADLGVEPSDDGRELWPFRMQLVAASAAAGMRGPLGPVFTAIGDVDGLRRDTAGLKRAGFGARQAIHPSQVAVINQVFTPTAEEVEHAEALLQLLEHAGGGVCVDESGHMVDEAVVRSARRVLDRHRTS
jgi:citrate lyase subunit beta / citryl-CoA lyase